MASQPQAAANPNVARILFLSRHDYRTPQRASVHFLARALAAHGHDVSFVSIGYSWLSRMGKDHRAFLDKRANRWEMLDGVNTYLWRTAWHAARLPLPNRQLAWLYDRWSRSTCPALDETAARADLIFVESGIAPLLIQRLRTAAPDARIVYRAADLLSTAGVPDYVEKVLRRSAHHLDHVIVVARAMIPHFENFPCPVSFVPHGIDRARLLGPTVSPYASPGNVVTVGAMLFDADTIRVAAEAFESLHFHLIGTPGGVFPENVTVYPEMSFDDTLPYLQHADIGFAAYRDIGTAPTYLSDSSLKLLQFNAIGLPGVCPHFAVGQHVLRFGYQVGDRDSLVAAFRAAAVAERRRSAALDWDATARQLLEAALA